MKPFDPVIHNIVMNWIKF